MAEAPRAAGTAAGAGEVPRWRRRLRWVGRLLVLGVVCSAPWWGRAGLRRMDFFRVRRVVVEGTRYAAPDEIVSRLRVDTTVSIWDDVAPLVARVREHPQVQAVRIGRRLPGTLVVAVTEQPPVALVATGRGFAVTDARGVALPVDPTRLDVDLPVLATRDTLLLRVLGAVRAEVPALYAEVSEARRGSRGEVILVLPTHRVLALADVTAARLADAVPVATDLARRGLVAAELDLRFRDQVVARLPDAP
ncbi:MAG: putative cell division protein FtsQ [Gemmatimonadota bacterium]|jgi:cell division protein FtsQ